MRRYFQTVWHTVFAALSCILFFSCTDVDHGLFWNIEHEEKIPDNSLPNDIGVYGMIKIPSLYTGSSQAQERWHPDGRYYLAGGALFFRESGSDWKRISAPGSGGIVNDVAWIDTGSSIEIYVSVMYGNSGRLFRLNEQVNPNYTIPNPSYDPLLPAGPSNQPRITDLTSTYTAYGSEIPYPNGGQIQRLISIDTDTTSAPGYGKPDEFFMSTGTPTNNSYQFFHCSWTGTKIDPHETGLSGEIITGGTYDSVNSVYWFVSKSHVFKVHPSALSSMPALPPSNEWMQHIVWEISSSSISGSDPDIFRFPNQRLSRFSDIFYDAGNSSSGSVPLVLSGIASPNYSTYNSNPNLYIACGDGLFMTTTQPSGTPQTWDRLSGGYHTSIAKMIYGSLQGESRLIAGREDSGLVEFERRDNLGTGVKEPYGHYPYGKYSDFSSLYNASVTRLLADGPIVIAGTTRSGAWNGNYSSGITSPKWSQE
ncbi:MAG: hypothetical protein LBK13_08460 [Spirochaetales bacterium]|nr:hypothetical protein [Spirochaetales bacterium]